MLMCLSDLICVCGPRERYVNRVRVAVLQSHDPWRPFAELHCFGSGDYVDSGMQILQLVYTTRKFSFELRLG